MQALASEWRRTLRSAQRLLDRLQLSDCACDGNGRQVNCLLAAAVSARSSSQLISANIANITRWLAAQEERPIMPPTLNKEWTLEMNPSAQDAHISIRTNSRALAEEYLHRLFPKSYIKSTPACCFVHFAENETDNAKAVGVLYETQIPSSWVTNRRVSEEGQRAA